MTFSQTLAVSALIAINEALIESGRLEASEEASIRKIIDMVHASYGVETAAPAVATPPVIILDFTDGPVKLETVGVQP